MFFFPELFRSFAAEAGTGPSFATAACSGTASGRYERLPTMALNLYRDRRQVKITLKIPVHFLKGRLCKVTHKEDTTQCVPCLCLDCKRI